MTAAGPRRPGGRDDCPPWCEADHRGPLSPVHQALIATINRGINHQVTIAIQADPRPAGPFVAVTARDLAADTRGGLLLSPDEALELALVMVGLGRADIAAHLRHAAELLSGAPDEGGAR